MIIGTNLHPNWAILWIYKACASLSASWSFSSVATLKWKAWLLDHLIYFSSLTCSSLSVTIPTTQPHIACYTRSKAWDGWRWVPDSSHPFGWCWRTRYVYWREWLLIGNQIRQNSYTMMMCLIDCFEIEISNKTNETILLHVHRLACQVKKFSIQ